MTTEIRVPTWGESVTEATVATWFKKPGDAVALDEMLCELETDKVTVEVPSPAAGVLSDIVAAEGTTVGVDALLANIASGAGNAEASDAAKTPDPKAPSNAAADSSDIEVAVPTLGESVTEATVASWFKAPGDSVKSDEILCELETDKVSVEVPSPSAGVLKKIIAAEGSTVDVTAILAVIGNVEEEGNAPAAQPIPEAASSTTKASSVEDAPAAKKAMAEAGLKPSTVQGTGRDGRVMKEDVTRAVAAAAQAPTATVQTPAAPRAPVMASDAAREERVKMTRLRQTIARRLKDSQNSAAMLTTYNEVDMSAVMDLRSDTCRPCAAQQLDVSRSERRPVYPFG